MGKSLSKPTDLRTYVKNRRLWEASIGNLSLPAARWEAETQESLRSLGVSYHMQWRKQQERPCLKMRWKTKTEGNCPLTATGTMACACTLHRHTEVNNNILFLFKVEVTPHTLNGKKIHSTEEGPAKPFWEN